MSLEFTIVKSPSGVSNVGTSMSFVDGGTIGRGQGNTWVLPDPDRFLSSRHCEITVEAERYYLVDTSTNGTFAGGSAEPIGKGGKVVISDGDCFELGDYQFSASLVGAAAPIDTPSSSSLPSDIFGVAPVNAEDSESSVYDLADQYFGSETSSSGADYFSDPFSDDKIPESQSVDPLMALGGQNTGGNSDYFGAVSSSPQNSAVLPDDLGLTDLISPSSDAPVKTSDDHSAPINNALDWPEVKQDSALPDDWFKDLEGFGGGNQTPSPVEPRPEVESVNEYANFSIEEQGAPLESTDLGVSAEPSHNSEPENNYFGVAPPKKEAKVGLQGGGASAQPISGSAQSGSAQSGDAITALFTGLGVDQSKLSDVEVVDVCKTVGEMLPVVIGGMMNVLRSRANIKNEFRMNVTTIQPVENNPLKFSPNTEEAIHNLFVKQSSAFKAPLEAFSEGFDSIGEHQIAIIAGIRAAFKGMMDRFDPERLETLFDKQNRGIVLPGLQNAKYWNAYVDYVKGFSDDMDNSFQYLFGEEFVEAYEEQLRVLDKNGRGF